MGKPMPTVPPWHLWGNLERITAPVETVGALRFGNQQQLVRITYGRPETWHWVFAAKLISGPDNTAGFFTRIFVHFDVTIGAGRSATLLQRDITQTFEDYTFQWGPVIPTFPSNALIYSTDVIAPNRSFQGDGPVVPGTTITQLTAESIQVQARVVALTVLGNVAAVGQPVVVEVSSYWAPKNHIRPDWFEYPPVFGGSETEGR